MSNQSSAADSDRRGHLDEVEAGAGCVEIWKHLSERRASSSAERDDDGRRR